MTTRYALTAKGEQALANDEIAHYVCPKIVAAQTNRPLHEIYDAIYDNDIAWMIDAYGNVGIDRDDITRLRRKTVAAQ